MKNVGIVFLDDDETFVNTLQFVFEKRDMLVDTYTKVDDFLNNLDEYSKDTKIVTDYELKSEMNGLELAEKLHKLGYTKLYMMTGRNFEKQEMPSYLTVLLKGIEGIDKLLEL
jgi:FixJ family two-component response regulator